MQEKIKDDTISRRAALDAVDAIGHIATMPDGDKCIRRSAVKYTLSMLPPAQPEHKVRFADKDHVWIDGKQYISLPRFQEAVKEAQPKEGHWIEGGIYRDVIECNCSECGQLMTTAATVRMNYCPNCGARMKGERQK